MSGAFSGGGLSIRSLRLRLGWTQADLARRLNCASSEIEIWESGQKDPQAEVLSQLEILGKQADVYSEELHQAPVLENLCEKKDLGQVDSSDID